MPGRRSTPPAPLSSPDSDADASPEAIGGGRGAQAEPPYSGKRLTRAGRKAAADPATLEPVSEHRITLDDGRTLGYAEYGDPSGDALIYHHGGMSCALDIAFADPWCRQHGIRVVAPDRPGVRDSSLLPGYRLEHSAADSAALADRLGIGNFAVAGWSAGGAHAIACAATLGDRITATATAGCPAPSDGPRLGLAFDRILYPAARRRPGLARFLIAFAAAAPARLRESQTRRALRSAADLRTLDDLPAGSLAAWMDGATAAGPRGVFDDYFATGSDWRGLARSTTAPVHVFHGAQDRLVPPPHGLRLAELLPAAELHPVEDSGHFLLHRHLPEVARALGLVGD